MTFYALSKWYGRTFKKLGWMVLAIAREDYEKLGYYERQVEKLGEALKQKLRHTKDADRRTDLQIMYDNVQLLREHVEKLRMQEEFQTFVQDLPFSVSE